ncbi:LrgB family protein [Paenibacillus sp. WQ 127069]|uniref:LrgB family protein n=1 Tax=Paenibacillus baimaensis TaxID=2982185 RepID=A0ABT2UW89_9BACL|nr:LrgB family protein [Paenibacillus sp. WQ 127069]MCU6798057.1 LrgB family protein [Paenibacillus sp. WQ 127069]
MSLHDFLQQPMFGLALSVIAYAIALRLNQQWKWLHPLFISSGLIIGFMLCAHIPYESYRLGGDFLVLLLGPATVALGIPIYKNARRIRSSLVAIMSGITIGSIAALLLSGVLVWSLGGTAELMVTMMPKSVTSPIALEISRKAGGIPELTAVLTVLTGLFGSMFGRSLLRLVGVRDDISIGVAMGTSSHGIGTARVIRDSELQGSISGFSMGAAAIITSLLFIPLYSWLH